VPGQGLEGHKLGGAEASLACNGLGTGSAPLGEQLAEAIRAVGLIIPGCEPLSGQGLGAVGAGEALPVPRVVAVGHSALGDHLEALDALGGELVLVALGAVDVVLLRDERLCANGVLAGAAHKALLMPLPRLVLHLLHTCTEYIAATVTTGSKLGIVARTAIYPVSFATKLFVHQTGSALVTQEATLMPVLLFVRQIL